MKLSPSGVPGLITGSLFSSGAVVARRNNCTDLIPLEDRELTRWFGSILLRAKGDDGRPVPVICHEYILRDHPPGSLSLEPNTEVFNDSCMKVISSVYLEDKAEIVQAVDDSYCTLPSTALHVLVDDFSSCATLYCSDTC